jgi:hypothetical protein
MKIRLIPATVISLPIIVIIIMFGFSSISTSTTQTLSLPIHSNFDEDIVDFQPFTGGLNRPTSIQFPASGHILVVSESVGLQTQPVEIYLPDDSEFGSIGYQFEPVSTGTLRVEAIVSIERPVNGYFLQTAAGPSRTIVARLGLNAIGEINGYFEPTIGTYSPGQPFRIRMDIDMDSKTWSVVMDDELNGFEDDELLENLEFLNGPDSVSEVSWLGADLNPFQRSGESRIAYDEISVFMLAQD